MPMIVIAEHGIHTTGRLQIAERVNTRFDVS